MTARRTGLVLCGSVFVLAGCFCALMVPLIVATQFAPPSGGDAVPLRMLVPSLLLYAGLAVAFVWIGAGSIQGRRWARTLALAAAWIWLVTGVVAVGMMALLAPSMVSALQADFPGEAGGFLAILPAFMVGVMSLLFVVLPGALVLFYRSPRVKAACEALDPGPAWTDARPGPVLGLSVSLALMAVSLLPSLLAYRSVVPLFGTILAGPAGAAVLLGLAGLWLWCARAVWRLQPEGWWAALVSTLVVTGSAFVTFLRVDLLEMYRTMGMSEDEIRLVRASGVSLHTGSLTIVTAAFAIGFVAYMISVKRHFRSVPAPLP